MKMQKPSLEDITIRNSFSSGDIVVVTEMHRRIYGDEYGYGEGFEKYVSKGLEEFYESYDEEKDRVWVCEDDEKIIGFMLGMHRGEENQFRYFVVDKAYRGIGLGKKLMSDYIAWVKQRGYKASYLWTTSELEAAASLYKRYGFVLVEEAESDRFGKRVTEQKYELKF